MYSRIYLLSTAFILMFAATPSAVAHAGPKDGAGAYATGDYRNLFAEAGHSPKEIQAKIDAAYAQLFHGDPSRPSPSPFLLAATPMAR